MDYLGVCELLFAACAQTNVICHPGHAGFTCIKHCIPARSLFHQVTEYLNIILHDNPTKPHAHCKILIGSVCTVCVNGE